MKTTFLAVSLSLSMTVLLPAVAADEKDAPGDAQRTTSTAAANHTGRGKVVSVDDQAGAVKLTHDPIKSLKWPKMTMNFKVHDPAMLKNLKPGDRVDFELTKMDGGYQIIKISPSTN